MGFTAEEELITRGNEPIVNINYNIFALHMLMLRPVEQDAQGQIYERVAYISRQGCGLVNVAPDFFPEDLNLMRQAELRIR